MSQVYLDASAAVKLVISEPESAALERFLAGEATRISSRVLAVELTRAAQFRSSDENQAKALLDVMEFVELDDAVAEAAGRLGPIGLRSLDAIHIASALALGDELAAFVTYDARQASAARAVGLHVESPA